MIKTTNSGRPTLPFGTTPEGRGYNVCVPAEGDTMFMRLFAPGETTSGSELHMTRSWMRVGSIDVPVHHIYVECDTPDIHYQLAVADQPLVDPYAHLHTGKVRWEDGRCILPQAVATNSIKPARGLRPNIRPDDMIIYEWNARANGGFAGLKRMLPWIKRQGYTSIEAMPINPCDTSTPFFNPRTHRPNKNIWGYDAYSWATVDADLASTPLLAMAEFVDLLEACNALGMELIMDVVFNHTGEGNEDGPTISFKALGAGTWYLWRDGHMTKDHTGVHNEINVNHPVVEQSFIDWLKYFVWLGVRGFRFDLAAVLKLNPRLISRMVSELPGVKLIMEPWALGFLHYLGNMGPGTLEWNDRFRNTTRKVLNGQLALAGEFRRCMDGYAGMFNRTDNKLSVNVMFPHDGFTPRDWASYNEKDVSPNGEPNDNGENNNNCWNRGPSRDFNGHLDASAPGPEGDRVRALDQAKVKEVLRNRQIVVRTAFVISAFAQGVPQFMWGGEVGRSANGNNNPWDDEAGNAMPPESEWDNDLAEFVRTALWTRKEANVNGSVIDWHGCEPFLPDGSDSSRTHAQVLKPANNQAGPYTYLAINWDADPEHESHTFELPEPPPGTQWRWRLDSSRLPGDDYRSAENAEPVSGHVVVSRFGAIVLVAA